MPEGWKEVRSYTNGNYLVVRVYNVYGDLKILYFTLWISALLIISQSMSRSRGIFRPHFNLGSVTASPQTNDLSNRSLEITWVLWESDKSHGGSLSVRPDLVQSPCHRTEQDILLPL